MQLFCSHHQEIILSLTNATLFSSLWVKAVLWVFHIVFRTKHGHHSIPNEQSEKLYRYIWGFVTNKKCFLYQVNGMPDHIHLLINLHPSISLAEFVKTLKTSTNKWLKENKEYFPDFQSWARKYCGLSYSIRDKEMIANYYIKKQREHHNLKKEDSLSEMERLLVDNHVKIDKKYWNEM